MKFLRTISLTEDNNENPENTYQKPVHDIFSLILLAASLCIVFFAACQNIKAETEDWVPQQIRSILARAENLDTSNPMRNTKHKLLAIYDEALGECSGISDTKLRKRTECYILAMKYQLIQIDSLSSDKWNELVQGARESGDSAIQAEALVNYAIARQFEVPDFDTLPVYDEAIDLYSKSGDLPGMQKTIFQKAIQIYTLSGISAARNEFAIASAIRLDEKYPADDRCLSESVAALGREFSQLEGNPREGTQILFYSATAEIFSLNENASPQYEAQPGFGGSFSSSSEEGDDYDIAIFWTVQNSGSIFCDMNEGKTERRKSFSFGSFPLESTVTSLSDTDTITVAAGTFKGCRHIRISTHDTKESAKEAAKHPDLAIMNGLLIQQLDIWYAPGVGLVKLERKRNGRICEAQLDNYEVRENGGGYFPVSEGNSWSYVISSDNKDISSRYKMRTSSVNQGRAYISSYSYVIKNQARR